MKKYVLLAHLLFLTAVWSIAQTPLSKNGRLKLVGNQLSNECGNPVQLRGMSTHGVMFHQNCYTAASVESLANDWGSDLIRLAIYTKSSGGETPGYVERDAAGKEQWNTWIDNMVNLAEENGMYVIIDWHILSDNDPHTYKEEAKTFFATMSERYKDKKHVLYEICNEPNGGVSWGRIKSYAEEVIPVIRANDPEGVILVGTPSWSSQVWDAANDPLTGSNAYNVMYTFHFYAGSHYNYNYLRSALGEIPIFVTEWGTVAASGDGGYNPGSADTWLSVLDGDNNGGVTVSSANWSFVDKDESASALTPGSCAMENWTSRTQPGNYIYNYISSPDNFTQCNSAADDDGDGVSNGDDICPGTSPGTYVDNKGCPALQGDSDNDGVIDAKDICANTPYGTKVNMHGCELLDDFVSNVCIGLNNYQGYARDDFSIDSLSNVNYWNRPSDNNPVYSSAIENGELVIDVTNADPDYATMGFSFGEIYTFNGTDYDTTLMPLDVSAHPVVEMDVYFQGNGYSETSVLLDVQLEDVDGNVVNADGLQNVMRKEVPLNQWVTITADFTDGSRESYSSEECGGTTPCYIENFDFSKVNKVKMNVNPGAGEVWSKPEFSGTWKIDNFSIGYNEETAVECTEIRDDDGDGVRQEDDKCPNTPSNASVNSNGCASFQLDDDNDGVVNPDDLCPDTPMGEEVDSRGCSASESDNDNDGVLDAYDLCLDTPEGETVNENGCSEAQLNADDDNDGVLNRNDVCPGTAPGATVDNVGCSDAQHDDDNDGTPNGEDECPNDPNKIAAGDCGCGISEDDCEVDCAGVINGSAYYDECEVCVGGNTGKEACVGSPYGGSPHVIPGIIQAEEYDLGGQDVSYNDSDAGNTTNMFRNDDVDIEVAENSGNNYNIAYTVSGEWLKYTVDVQGTGTYFVSVRVASDRDLGAWHLKLDGQTLPGTSMSTSATGGWQTYKEVSASESVYIPAGLHTLQLYIDGPDINIDRIEFTEDVITGIAPKEIKRANVYPVPANKTLYIDQKVRSYNKAVIMDLTGNPILEKGLSGNKEELNIEKLPKGSYLIQLTGPEKSEVIQVIVQ